VDKFDTPPIITFIAVSFVRYLVLCAEEVLTPTTDYGLSRAEVFYSNPKQRSKQFVPIAPYFCNTAKTGVFIRLYNSEISNKQEERIFTDSRSVLFYCEGRQFDPTSSFSFLFLVIKMFDENISMKNSINTPHLSYARKKRV
jgi:hypothetical protein